MMSEDPPAKELMVSLNFLLPEALKSEDTQEYTERIAGRLEQVISEELKRLGVCNKWESTCFHHLGTEIVADSTRCSECNTWVIPEEKSHITSVVASGWRVEDGRILCDQCWSLFDGDKMPIKR